MLVKNQQYPAQIGVPFNKVRVLAKAAGLIQMINEKIHISIIYLVFASQEYIVLKCGADFSLSETATGKHLSHFFTLS